MQKNPGTGLSRRLLTSAALAAALAAGTVAATVPALAATPRASGPNVVTNLPLPKLGARKAPFSPTPKTAATTASAPGPASAASNPWIVGIETSIPIPGGSQTHICTGTVLSPTKILTAAACDTATPSATTEVIAGRDDLADDSVGFVDGVASVFTDPAYDPNGPGPSHNIEVLTLTQPLPSVYTPVSLSAQGDETPYRVGGHLLTLGYGLDANIWSGLSQQSVTTQDSPVCLSVPSRIYYPGEEVCDTSDNDVLDTFNVSDMGDPLIAAGKQIGIGNDALPRDTAQGNATFLPFERLSIFHDEITADLARPNPGSLDWTGDGISDLFAQAGNGNLAVYQGNGSTANGGFGVATPVGTVPVSTYQAMRGTNWYGDGRENLIAVNYKGELVSYPETSAGGLGTAQIVGTDWFQFSWIISTSNFTGDGRPDVIAERGDGTLWLYERNGNGWLHGNGVQIGSGFQEVSDLVPFQWTNNCHIGLLAVDKSGTLEFYGTDGAGHWTNNGIGQPIGSGFGGSTYNWLVAPGSWAGRDTGALLARDDGGQLWAFYANGTGGWINNGARTLVGNSWDLFSHIF